MVIRLPKRRTAPKSELSIPGMKLLPEGSILQVWSFYAVTLDSPKSNLLVRGFFSLTEFKNKFFLFFRGSVMRTRLSKRIRFEIFKRDGFVCQYCGDHPPNAILHIDHVVPVSEGGANDDDNLVTACQACNLGKSDVLLSAVPQSLADKAKEVQEREEQLRGYSAILQARRDRLETETWSVLKALFDDGVADRGIRKDWFGSVKRFIERLGYHTTLDNAEYTRERNLHNGDTRVFKYFCAVCWNHLREVGDAS